MPDFPIRIDLQKLGLPERTIRVLEKAARIVDILETASEQAEAIETITEDIEDANLSLTSLDTRVDALETPPPVKQDQTTAWVDSTGTGSRATFATFAGQAVSNPPTQAEVQAIDDHVKILSQRLGQLINDLRTIHALT